MRTVIICGMIGPYRHPKNGAEIWGVNKTYLHQPNIDRLYFMDPIDLMEANFIESVNNLGCDIFARREHPELPKCQRYPFEEIVKNLGLSYFTSTMTYMIAHALYEGVDKLIMHRLHCYPESSEYFHQKAALDFWCGYAMGRGVQLCISDDSKVCRPHPWQSSRYGYESQENLGIATTALAGTVDGIMKMPINFHPMDGDPVPDHYEDPNKFLTYEFTKAV